MLRMDVPHPTSSTTLSLKMCLLLYIASRYDFVRISSFYVECLVRVAIEIELEDLSLPAFLRGCLTFKIKSIIHPQARLLLITDHGDCSYCLSARSIARRPPSLLPVEVVNFAMRHAHHGVICPKARLVCRCVRHVCSREQISFRKKR